LETANKTKIAMPADQYIVKDGVGNKGCGGDKDGGGDIGCEGDKGCEGDQGGRDSRDGGGGGGGTAGGGGGKQIIAQKDDILTKNATELGTYQWQTIIPGGNCHGN
jgi:hypothetical protein